MTPTPLGLRPSRPPHKGEGKSLGARQDSIEDMRNANPSPQGGGEHHAPVASALIDEARQATTAH
ncbi:MAG: hypothetical protein JWN07_1447 [Hyphomicrobiales bacterium]|nr:hypothetical protein [Hyphomicrobiales bacterium]